MTHGVVAMAPLNVLILALRPTCVIARINAHTEANDKRGCLGISLIVTRLRFEMTRARLVSGGHLAGCGALNANLATSGLRISRRLQPLWRHLARRWFEATQVRSRWRSQQALPVMDL